MNWAIYSGSGVGGGVGGGGVGVRGGGVGGFGGLEEKEDGNEAHKEPYLQSPTEKPSLAQRVSLSSSVSSTLAASTKRMCNEW